MRSKRAKWEMVDWDLNIYQYPNDKGSLWHIDPYVVEGNNHYQYDHFTLTPAEAYAIMNRDEYFEGQDDVWYGMSGFLFDYWDRLSDRVRFLLESLPKYIDELDRSKI